MEWRNGLVQLLHLYLQAQILCATFFTIKQMFCQGPNASPHHRMVTGIRSSLHEVCCAFDAVENLPAARMTRHFEAS